MPGSDSSAAVVHVLDAGSYAVRGSWNWPPDQPDSSWPLASNEDGSMLLMGTADGVLTFNVAAKAVKGVQSVPDPLTFVGFPTVSRDLSRVYLLAVKQRQSSPELYDGHVIVIDADPGTGSLTLERDVELGSFRIWSSPPCRPTPRPSTCRTRRTS